MIRLFELLRHSGIETCYAGSATTWGDKTSALGQDFHSPERSKDRFRLQQDLEDVTDVFLGDVTQATAARYSNSAWYHVHVAHHDCSCQNQQEAALGGAVLWGLAHPLSAERPVFWESSVEALSESILSYQQTFDAAQHSQEVYDFAMANWSYDAFEAQFKRIVGGNL